MTAGADLRTVQRRLDANTRRTSRAIGRQVDTIVKATARPVTGGDGALGGHRRRPIRLRTRTRIYAEPSVTTVIVWGVPAGPWRWINDGTRPHQIRRRRRGPLSRMFVDHPGMSGFGSWDEAERVVQQTVPGKFFLAVQDAVQSLGVG